MKIKLSLILTVIITVILFFTSLVIADTNGIWHRAEDIRGGVFGSDEGAQNYTFNVPVYLLNSVLREGQYFIDINGTSYLNNVNANKLTTNYAYIYYDLNVTGDIYQNGSKVATLNSSGKIPTNLLPFP